MPDILRSNPAQSGGGRIQWGSAITAGLVATIVMTVVMALMKMNIVKMLGSMIVGSDASAATQYIVGGAMHFMIGIGYGVIYAALLGRVVEWNRVIKGTVYGLAIAAIALAAMPVMSSMMGGGSAGAQNPCGGSSGQAAAMNPCHPQSGQASTSATNPCQGKDSTAAKNPCQGKDAGAMNPCAGKQAGAAKNPCQGKQAGAMNPCADKQAASAMNPCAGKQAADAANPCQGKATAGASNPCHGAGAGNPCNPCGGSSGPWGGVLSVINHLVYALTLAFVYGKVR